MIRNKPERLRVLVIESSPERLRRVMECAAAEESNTNSIGAPVIDVVGATEVFDEASNLILSLKPDAVVVGLYESEQFVALHQVDPEMPLVVLVDAANETLAREAIHQGADEYLVFERLDAFWLERAIHQAVERARYRQELARERAYMYALLDNIPDRIYFKDEQSRFIRINRALAQLFGLEHPRDAIGKTDADFYGDEHASEARSDELRVMRTGEALVNKEESEVLRDGRRSWSLTTKLALRNRDGKVVGTCGISRDVTVKKEMEERLAHERNLLRVVIDNLPDHIFLKDSEGRYLLDNVAHQKWLGAESLDAVIGKSPEDFFPPEVAESFRKADTAVLDTGAPSLVNYEERAMSPSNHVGDMRWAMVTKVPWFGENGEVLGLVCIKRNISEQKIAEQQRNAAMEELQKAHTELRSIQMQLIEAEKMKTIGRLAAGIAHEVKNPLAVIRMGVDFLEQEKFEDSTIQTILEEMQEAVRRADSVILGLLDFSKPNQIEAKETSIQGLIDEALKAVRVEMSEPVKVVREEVGDLPAVMVDSEKMKQVLVNLLTNSLHAMPNGGTLTVRTGSRQLTGVGNNIGGSCSESFRVGQRLLVLEIEDTGCGIPEDKLAKVFEPFFTTKPTGKGTGLGLSVVKTIVDLHGGTIAVTNREECGVRVTVLLPLS